MNNFNFEDWRNHHEIHINNLFYIFRNNLNDIDKTCINNEDILYEKFVKFIYKNSTKYRLFNNPLLDDNLDFSDAENTNFKYSHLK